MSPTPPDLSGWGWGITIAGGVIVFALLLAGGAAIKTRAPMAKSTPNPSEIWFDPGPAPSSPPEGRTPPASEDKPGGIPWWASPDQSPVAPDRAEQMRVEWARVEQMRAEQARAEQVRAEQARARQLQVDELLGEGDKLAKQKQFVQSLVVYGKAIELDPESWMAWYNLGCVHMKLNDHPNAARAFETCITLNRSYENGWHNLILTYAAMGRVVHASEALKSLRRVNQARAQELTRKFSSDFVRKLALAEYPEIGVADSAYNRQYVALYDRYRSSDPQFFRHNDWPLVLAAETAWALQQRE